MMDPNPMLVQDGQYVTTTSEEVGNNSDELIDICSLCDYQCTANTSEAFRAYSQFKNRSARGSEADDVLRVFLADKNERSLRLELCPSCKDQCEQLLETSQQLSLLVDLVSTLLLQNSRFTLVHPKQVIIEKLFADTALQEYFTRSRLELLDPLGSKGIADSLGLKNAVVDIADIDREIDELETQFHIDNEKLLANDRVKSYDHGGNRYEDENEGDRRRTLSPSLCSSLPSLVSLDSCSSVQKDPLGNNIMNVNISALESSGSSGYEQTPPKSKSKSSPKNMITSITNLIANTTNDELEVCFSNKIQKMKQKNEAVKNGEGSKTSENIFRLPLPPGTFAVIPVTVPATKNESKKAKTTIQKDQNGKKRYVCTICPKTWDSKRDLETHIGSHLKVSNFICDVCGMAYRHKSALKTHVALHKGDAKYKCEDCQKHFTQKSGLERHQEAIHSNARNYICDICQRTFRYHSSFNLHKQSHKETPVKKFRCDLPSCSQSFFTSYHLKRHVKTHTGDKPHKCSHCEKAFAEKYNLESHLKTHLKAVT